MSNINIHIIELGPVKDCNLSLAPVMLFTGKSNLGKSYVNFLAYYVYSLFSGPRIYEFISNKITVDLENAKKFSFSLKIDELRLWMENDVKSFFQYLLSYKDIACQVQFLFDMTVTKFDFEYNEPEHQANSDSGYFTASLSVNGRPQGIFMNESFKKEFLLYDIRRILCEAIIGKTITRSILLPPGRASLLSGNYSTQSSSSRLGMYDIFLRDNDSINRNFMRNINQEVDKPFFMSQIHNLINGNLIAGKDGLSLVLDDGREIPMDAAASSVKELTPLLLWMQGERIADQSVCLEEPEAHLHPEMQIAVADLLAACINKGTYMQITTHSDYFMQRVNQLLMLGRMRKKDEEAYKQFCQKNAYNTRHYLDSEMLNAYYFYVEDGNTKCKLMEIGEEGIPMSTFFTAIDRLDSQEAVINGETDNGRIDAEC